MIDLGKEIQEFVDYLKSLWISISYLKTIVVISVSNQIKKSYFKI
jgi:hypothetical protein